MQKFFSNGKLLLTGEYVVLDGALSLAIPTKYGQSLIVEPIDELKIIWTSIDENRNVWFEGEFSFDEIVTSQAPHNDIKEKLIQILNEAKRLNPDFLSSSNGYKVSTKLDFPKHWGLGTSSTLINNIAQWANIDAFKLLENTFGGSGYDIACAQYDSAITYQLKNEILNQVQNGKRIVKKVDFNPSFKEHLYFVYLNKKQNSRDGIKHYHENKNNLASTIKEINSITQQIISCDSLNEFEGLITKHEQIISKITKQKPVKELLFSDFKGSIKSLGAWGGDFILIASKENPEVYFRDKGYTTIIKYSDMIK